MVLLDMRRRFRRKIGVRFADRYYKPRGIPLRQLGEVVISHEELETLRLRYVEGFSQENSAQKMGISQSQFQRDLWDTKKKITAAIIDGNAIRIADPAPQSKRPQGKQT